MIKPPAAETQQLDRWHGLKTREKKNEKKAKNNPCTPLILTLASRECPRSEDDKHPATFLPGQSVCSTVGELEKRFMVS